MEERLEGSVEVDDFAVRLGFRIVSELRLAGGPVEVEFFAEGWGDRVAYLAVGGDRSRGRLAWFTFPTTYDGAPLSDPKAHLPNFGGPSTAAELEPGRPVAQRLLLNDFVTLEATAAADGDLVVRCRRPPYVGWTREEAIVAVQDPVEVELGVRLHRDDEALRRLVTSLVEQVLSGSLGEREVPLRVLLALRAPLAVEVWSSLAEHPDAAVRDVVRAALRSS